MKSQPQEALPDLPEIVAAIEKALEAGPTPGVWDVDSTKNDGEYGNNGPDTRSGFNSYVLFDENGGSICDTLNSDVAEIEEWYDEDDGGALDIQGRRNMEYIAACSPTNIRALLSERTRLQAQIEALGEALKKANEQTEHFERNWYLRGDALEKAQARIDEADAIILRLTADHNSSPNYVRGFDAALDYFTKYAS